jgi:GNAT superfamily N-acetyltransferase
MMVSDLLPVQPPAPIRVEVEDSTDAAEWIRVVSQGFESGEEVGAIIAAVPGVRLFLVRDTDGEALGGAAMVHYDGVSILFGDSTLPEYRGRGAHLALIQRRICVAQKSGRAAAALILPAGVSRRNYEKAGFRFSHKRHVFTRRVTVSR